MNKSIFQITLGVDIAKKKFDVACLIEDKYKHKHFTNDVSGYTDFVIWFMALCGDVNPLICMEATGAIVCRLLIF
jgi:transposase